jgi:hypothetical protein
VAALYKALGLWALHVVYALLPRRTFRFRGKEYVYCAHWYNGTWRNERAVEIPIAQEFLESAYRNGKRVLEIGHTLGRYMPTHHDVADKYEETSSVIREDIATWKPVAPYDAIISVSTMEHVDWNEEPRTPELVLVAFQNVIDNCLAEGGEFMVTIPFGWNIKLDEYLASGRLKFDVQYFLKRTGKNRNWREASWEEVRGALYDFFVYTADALCVGLISRRKVVHA